MVEGSSNKWFITFLLLDCCHVSLRGVSYLNILQVTTFHIFIKWRLLWEVLSKAFICYDFLRSDPFEACCIDALLKLNDWLINLLFLLLRYFVWSWGIVFVWGTRWKMRFPTIGLLRGLSPWLRIVSLTIISNWLLCLHKVIVNSFGQLLTHFLSNGWFLLRCSSSISRYKLILIRTSSEIIDLN